MQGSRFASPERGIISGTLSDTPPTLLRGAEEDSNPCEGGKGRSSKSGHFVKKNAVCRLCRFKEMCEHLFERTRHSIQEDRIPVDQGDCKNHPEPFSLALAPHDWLQCCITTVDTTAGERHQPPHPHVFVAQPRGCRRIRTLHAPASA